MFLRDLRISLQPKFVSLAKDQVVEKKSPLIKQQEKTPAAHTVQYNTTVTFTSIQSIIFVLFKSSRLVLKRGCDVYIVHLDVHTLIFKLSFTITFHSDED